MTQFVCLAENIWKKIEIGYKFQNSFSLFKMVIGTDFPFLPS